MKPLTGSGRIVTFYSYKRGVGRSMALANVAWILAANGNRVLAIDWDLQAPSLHRYFRPFLTETELHETPGLIDTFWTFAAECVTATFDALGVTRRDYNRGRTSLTPPASYTVSALVRRGTLWMANCFPATAV